MNQEKPVYAGNLLFPPQGKIVLKKSWHSKYCLLFNASKLGIERLEVYDNFDDYPKQPPNKIYTLENCIKLFQRDASSFSLITKTWSQNFGTQTTNELNDWMTAFQTVAFSKDDSSSQVGIVEDNELYCSSSEGVFTVKLCPSEASIRCGLEPKTYTLVISSTSTKLKDCETSKTLYTWPHHYIRQYGYRGGKFTFEAGRKCDSGEGKFYLEHSNQQAIFRCLSSKIKSMRKLLKGETTNTSLDCGDNQFHAALSMEARSRSPLPPSPTSSTKFRDIDNSLSSSSNNSSGKGYFKTKPLKPPRKNLPINQQHTSSPDYEPICTLSTGAAPIGDYDRVEVRSEAWRTLGVDDVKHSESIDSDNDLNLECCRSQENLDIEDIPLPPPASKVISNSSSLSSVDSYDKLQFFGSTSKLAEVQGYKQMIVPKTNNNNGEKNRDLLNDYEEVQALQIDMEAVRLADDSHLGYGMIRKQSATKILPETSINIPHHVVNDTAYAIISKPKRV